MQSTQQETMDRLAGRLFAAIPSGAGAPAPLDDLDRNLGRTIDNAQALKASSQALKARIDRVVGALDKPRKVADALKGLSGDLGNLSTALRVAQVVRAIRPLADALRFQVDGLKRVVDAAEARVRSVDHAVQPLRERLRAIAGVLAELVKRLDEIVAHTTGARAKIAGVRRCMTALPAGAVRDRGLALLDDFARSVDPPVAALADALAEAGALTATLDGGLKGLEQRLDQLESAVLGEIEGVRRVFGPILSPLAELAKALDYRIGIKIFSFSVRDILNGISLPWPFSYVEDLFWKAAMSILDPILRGLKLDIALPGIPSLGLLDGIQVDFPAIPRLQVSLAALPSLSANLRGLLDRFQIACPPAVHAPAFSDQLLAELAEAEPQVVM